MYIALWWSFDVPTWQDYSLSYSDTNLGIAVKVDMIKVLNQLPVSKGEYPRWPELVWLKGLESKTSLKKFFNQTFLIAGSMDLTCLPGLKKAKSL